MGSSTEQSGHGPVMVETAEEGFSILRLLALLGQQKWWMLLVFLLVMAACFAVSVIVPKKFVSTAILMSPAQPNNSAAVALGQLSGLATMTGALGGMKSQDELMVALLRSRRVQDELIDTLQLASRYQTGSREIARRMLNEHVAITLDKKSGLITVEATDLDADFSARLANAHVDVLRKTVSRLAITEAQQRRQFLEQQLGKARLAFATADAVFRQAQARTGFAVAPVLAETSVREGVALRMQISSQEIRLQSLAQSLTQQHPEFQRALAELSALRRKLAQLESGTGESSAPKGDQTALDAYRDMRVQESVLDELIKQLEMAKLDEAREGPGIQLIDAAVPPEGPSKPSKRVILIAGVLLALVLSVAVAVCRTYLIRERARPDSDWIKAWQAWFGGQAKTP